MIQPRLVYQKYFFIWRISVCVLLLFCREVIAQCLGPAEAPAYINAAEILRKVKIWQANNLTDKIIQELSKIPASDSAWYEAQYRILEAFAQNNDYDSVLAKGLPQLNDLLHPWRSEIISLVAAAKIKKNDAYTALELLNKAIAAFPFYGMLYYHRAKAYQLLQSSVQARRNYQMAAQINPTFWPAHWELAQLYRLENKPIPAFLSGSFVLMLSPPDSIFEQCVAFLEAVADWDGYKYPPDASTEEGDFTRLHAGFIAQQGAKREFRSRFRNSALILQQLDYVQRMLLSFPDTDTGFVAQFYVPFYQQIEKNDHTSGLAYLYLQRKTDEKSQKDYLRNESDVSRLQVYFVEVIPYLASIEIKKDGRLRRVPLWYNAEGKIIAAGEKNHQHCVGYWWHFYPNHHIEACGEYDKTGFRTGKWYTYHFNGVLNGEVTYLNGELTDSATYFYDNKAVLRRCFYYKNLLHGMVTEYYRNGAVAGQAKYTLNAKDGPVVEYFPSGRPAVMGFYKSGKPDGLWHTWYPGGQLRSRMRYQNGEKQDSVYQWYSSGIPEFEGYYHQGKKHLYWVYYDSSGRPKKTMNYLFDLLHDEVRTYYNNGNIKSIERYHRGLRSGKSTTYDRNGQITLQYDYENDRAVSFLAFDSLGSIQASGGSPTGNFVAERKNRSGQLLESCRFVNGKKEGEHKLFYPNGILAELTRYEKGLPWGKSLQFYPSGTIRRQVSYEYGGSGTIIEETNYYPDGKVSSQHFNLPDGGYRICHYSTQGCRISDQYFNNQGLAVGLQRFYRPDGKPFYELKYDEKGALINAVTYSIDELITDTVYFDVQGNGKLVVYYSDKKPVLEGAFKSGVQDGDWVLLDRNSEVLVSNQYLNGFLDGAYYVYYPSGDIRLEGQYRLGKPELLWREFYENGQVAVSGKYKAGVKDGKWLYFREDGTKDIEEHWQNGIQEGPTKWFAPDGSVQIILFYKAGIITKYGWFQRNGRLTRRQLTTEKLMSYFKNGSIAAELTQSNGSLHGLARRFYPNATLSQLDSFSFGYRHGRQIRYSSDQLPAVIKNYYYGRLHGVYQLYDANGKIIREEEYCFGDLIGDQNPLTGRQITNKKTAPK